MRRTTIAAALCAVIPLGCDRDPSGADCVCEPQTALETPFDNGPSGLGAENVQDALDELAARPLAGRLYFTNWFSADPVMTPGVGVGTTCDENPGHVALSASCELAEGGSPDPTVVPILQSHSVENSEGTCSWWTTDGRPWGGRFKIRLLCLDPTP